MSRSRSTNQICIALSLTTLLFAAGVCAAPVKALVAYAAYPKGNIDYPPIPGAANDAILIRDRLKSMKHAVKLVKELPGVSQGEWDAALVDYLANLTADDYAFVYVAAHGFRANGRTYFVDSNFQPVEAEKQFAAILAKKAKASIFFVDICRTRLKNDAPTPTGAELVGRDATILFSTDAGAEAGDRGAQDGRHSVFAQATAEQIIQKQELRITLRNIVKQVSEQPGHGKHKQNPWPYGIITFDVYLAGEPPRPRR